MAGRQRPRERGWAAAAQSTMDGRGGRLGQQQCAGNLAYNSNVDERQASLVKLIYDNLYIFLLMKYQLMNL